MTPTENTFKDLKKENLITLVLNLENDQEKFTEKFSESLVLLSNIVDNFSSKLDQFESSLAVIKTVNNNLLNQITSIVRSLHVQE